MKEFSAAWYLSIVSQAAKATCNIYFQHGLLFELTIIVNCEVPLN